MVSALTVANEAVVAAGLHHVLTYETPAGTAIVADSVNLHRVEITQLSDGQFTSRISDAGTAPAPWLAASETAATVVAHTVAWLRTIHR